VTSSLLRQRKTSPNYRHKIFHFGPSQSKYVAMPVVKMLMNFIVQVNAWLTWLREAETEEEDSEV